jgi:hypothetical protein
LKGPFNASSTADKLKLQTADPAMLFSGVEKAA